MIREYRTEDTDALVSIWRSATSIAHPFLSDTFVDQEAENMRTMYLPNAETWVLENGEGPTGFIALINDEIGGLFLDPPQHGQGHGRAMVDHAVGIKGALRVEVFEQNSIGRRFYDRYGFVETGRYTHGATNEVVIQMGYQLI